MNVLGFDTRLVEFKMVFSILIFFYALGCFIVALTKSKEDDNILQILKTFCLVLGAGLIALLGYIWRPPRKPKI